MQATIAARVETMRKAINIPSQKQATAPEEDAFFNHRIYLSLSAPAGTLPTIDENVPATASATANVCTCETGRC
jgi:hypothetical protein